MSGHMVSLSSLGVLSYGVASTHLIADSMENPGVPRGHYPASQSRVEPRPVERTVAVGDDG